MRTRILLGGTILVAALALAPATAFGAQRYASPGASGTDCTQLNPCDARYAISGTAPPNPVADGDEVILLHSALPYDFGNSSEVSITNSIDVHGEVGFADPVLNGGSTAGLVRVANSTATLHDVDIEYGGSAPSGAGALMVTSGTAYRVVAHTLIANNTACTLAGDTTAPDALIRDSLCWGEGSGGVGVGLACMCLSFNASLRNVDAFGTDYGIRFHSQQDSQAFTIGARNVIADGNVDDVFADAGVSGQTNVHTSIALDHSAYDSYGSHAIGTGSSFSVTAVGADATNVIATPAQMLMAPSLGNFHQLATSPTIDKGATDSLTGTTDLDGNARIQGTIDIGAYETALTTPPGGGSGNPQGKSPAKKKCKKKKHRAASAKKCKKHKK